MAPQKHCAQCGRLIARELETDYFRYIRLKYCPQCAADVRRRQKADYMRRLRAARTEQHRLEHEQNELLKTENELLRQAIRRLESTLQKGK
jgi:endogenous inhibitor of DNA gyrase (YacG/DUF329 family)